MGSATSKTAQTATRKFPARATGAVPPASKTPAPRSPPPTSRATPQASFARDEAIHADGMDPDPMASPAFSQRLKQMGVVTPNPTLSNSSTVSSGPPAPGSASSGPQYPMPSHNQTLRALEARRGLQELAELQSENLAAGREYADVGTLRHALIMRKRGLAASDIEKRLRLRSGVVAKIESGGAITPLGL